MIRCRGALGVQSTIPNTAKLRKKSVALHKNGMKKALNVRYVRTIVRFDHCAVQFVCLSCAAIAAVVRPTAAGVLTTGSGLRAKNGHR